MTRRSRSEPRPCGKRAVSAESLSATANRYWLLAVAGCSLALAVAGTLFLATSSKAPPPASSSATCRLPVAAAAAAAGSAATYVGAETCKTCHEPEFKAWSGSHHQLAMQEANAASVLGDFANVKFRQHGVESTFFKRGDKFMVRTDGPTAGLRTTRSPTPSASIRCSSI
jgi:cytochrome c553